MRGLSLSVLLMVATATGKPLPPTLPLMPAPTSLDRVLVIAPHPDDETLCCGGFLQQAIQSGATVGIVWVTAGDSFEIDAILTERTLRPKGAGLERLGLKRIAEAHGAADLLGVPRTHQYLLGFPDRDIGLLWREPHSAALRSRYTGVNAVPYAEALHPGQAYTGVNLSLDLQEVIAGFAPTVVLAAAPMDRHGDHSASGALSLALLHVAAPNAKLYYWIVHGGHKWPSPRGLHRERALLPPTLAKSLDWRQVPLTELQSTIKLAALNAHRTQLAVMSRFLRAFIRSNEIFAPAVVPVAPAP